MTTTTIGFPEELKSRVEAAEKRASTSTQSFILDAIVQKTELEDLCADFDG